MHKATQRDNILKYNQEVVSSNQGTLRGFSDVIVVEMRAVCNEARDAGEAGKEKETLIYTSMQYRILIFQKLEERHIFLSQDLIHEHFDDSQSGLRHLFWLL